MKIYRGNIGVDLSLDEFSELLEDDEQIDDLLNLINELEMDEVMMYSDKDMQEFECQLMQEVNEYQRKIHASDDLQTMERILARLKKYE